MFQDGFDERKFFYFIDKFEYIFFKSSDSFEYVSEMGGHTVYNVKQVD